MVDEFGDPKDIPILFEEINRREHNPRPPYNEEGAHVYVLVHGFQGNSFDMQILRNMIFLNDPEALIMCSMDNEEHTDGNIHEMGLRLANEITSYIEENCPGNALAKLSLIGHSLGGIICRACLPFIVEFH